ncbi:MAG TPA: GTPase HflX [Clostridiaceae bacterium]|nr:GTPase HflX [Clostridiaceae bacterium]
MQKKETALLIGVNINNQPRFKESMEELKNLAIACELEVVGSMEQNLKSINPVFCIGSGKVEEVSSLADETEAEVLIFNNELSPLQLRNLEKELECRVIDRTYLILEIFAKRAKTREAKLQVEVARLQYMLPRLIGSNESLGRQRGGIGTKNRGAGETKLETDRRKIQARILELNNELELLENEHKIQRKLRYESELPSIALVGYTNSGKSTIMNAMVDMFRKSEAKKVLEKDMLFATLDTTVRRITLSNKRTFLLADTVGFVSNLPHNLIKAFRSTLEEVCEADLLIHVVDISNPHYKEQIDVTMKTLKEIGAENIPVIYAYNKIDLVDFDIPHDRCDCVYISAKLKKGMDKMVDLICSKVFREYVQCKMLIPYDRGDIFSYLNENYDVKSIAYKDKGTLIDLECRQSDYKKYQQYVSTN